jgi:hypothetical protein
MGLHRVVLQAGMYDIHCVAHMTVMAQLQVLNLDCAGMLYHTTVCFADIASFPAANDTTSAQVHVSSLNMHA